MILQTMIKRDIVSKSNTKGLCFSFCLFVVCGLSSCVSSTEESILLFENYLESFKGRKVRDVINWFGEPTQYYNTGDYADQANGTYMIYDYRPKNNDCVIRFMYERSTLQILEWDYKGNCLLFDGK